MIEAEAASIALREDYRPDDREIATILAALRFYQEHGQGEPMNRSDAIHQLAVGDDDEFVSLCDEEIDELCERLNCGAEPEPEGEAMCRSDVALLVSQLEDEMMADRLRSAAPSR